jgi:hypothetical protein
MFLVCEMNCLMGTGGDAYPVEVTPGLINRGETIKNGNGMLRTDEDAGTGPTTLLEINKDLGHTKTFLEGS